MAEARELVDTVGGSTEGLLQSAQAGPRERDAAPTLGCLWASEVFLLLSSFAYCFSLCQLQGKDAVRMRKLKESWEFPGWSLSSLGLLTG